MADSILDTVLLLALPASGKSEVRRYIGHLSPEVRRRDFHLGPDIQLDDFPYVHLMRRVDDELAKLGQSRVFFQSPDMPFRNPIDWGTLIALLNEDYARIGSGKSAAPPSAAEAVFQRIDRCAASVGGPVRLGALKESARRSLALALENECGELVRERRAAEEERRDGKTVIIEFARGGPQGAAMPLASPFGYQASLAWLSEEILRRAAILYVWVTPEESRRKNAARTDPNNPGSILHHGVPIDVMLNDYGCDDIDWLEGQWGASGAIAVKARGRTFRLPFARFDNRIDKTSFLRGAPASWKDEDVRLVHRGLQDALSSLKPETVKA
ncbi:MAG: hypothetical protein HYY16_17905 [Planctomycetes bacterium]|nr:hypothetical protein [Planctomycetota bacterium]